MSRPHVIGAVLGALVGVALGLAGPVGAGILCALAGLAYVDWKEGAK